MSRLTLGRTPISERIKVFDASASPKRTPARAPSRPRAPSITPTVDLKPVPKGATKEPGARGQESLRKAPEKLARTPSVNRSDSSVRTPLRNRSDSSVRAPSVNRSDSSVRAPSVNRSDSSVGGKPRLARTPSVSRSDLTTGGKTRLGRTDSTKTPLDTAAKRGQIQPVNSPRVSRPAPDNQTTPTTAPRTQIRTQTSPQTSGNKPAVAKTGPGGRAAPQKNEITGDLAEQKHKHKISAYTAPGDVKPDVTADIQTREEAIDDVNDLVPDDTVKEESAEAITAKLIMDLRGEVVVSQEDSLMKADTESLTFDGTGQTKDLKYEQELQHSHKQVEGQDQMQIQEQERKQELEQEERKQMSAKKLLEDGIKLLEDGIKLGIQEVEDQSFLPKKSIHEVEKQPYVRKKSAVEVEVEAPYFRRESLAKNSTPDYRSSSRQLEELKHLSDNQYFTKQALSNATSITINQAMKLDVEYKEDKITSLGKEMVELEARGAAEEEVARLKKQKQDLEARLRDQEEELDDLAGQVQQLEAGKVKLDADLNQCKKEQRRELQCKEDELEDARAATQKKVKVLEQQLEQEHEERITFMRERHDLEGKIIGLQDLLERSGDEELVAKLKKDLKKTKALLKDAHLMLDKSQNEGTNKVIMRQLKNQLEDAEFARSAAMKSKQNAELELADVQVQLEDVSRARADLDQKNLTLSRERADLATHLQETEEDLQDVMRKYKAAVSAVTTDQITIQDQGATIQSLEAERNKLREQCAEISQRLEHMDGENVSSAQHKRLELKIRELESKLELEKTTKGRLETQIHREKEGTEKMLKEIENLRLKEAGGQEEQKKLARTARDLKEELGTLQGKEVEVTHKKGDLEKQLEVSEAETVAVRGELKTALKRVEDLQAAITGDLESSNSDGDSDSDEEMSAFMDHHRRAMSVQRDRESQMREMRVSQTRELRSVSREPREQFRESRDITSMSRDIRASVAREFESATRDLPPVTARLELPGVQLRPVEEANTSIPFNVIKEEE